MMADPITLVEPFRFCSGLGLGSSSARLVGAALRRRLPLGFSSGEGSRAGAASFS